MSVPISFKSMFTKAVAVASVVCILRPRNNEDDSRRKDTIIAYPLSRAVVLVTANFFREKRTNALSVSAVNAFMIHTDWDGCNSYCI